MAISRRLAVMGAIEKAFLGSPVPNKRARGPGTISSAYRHFSRTASNLMDSCHSATFYSDLGAVKTVLSRPTTTVGGSPSGRRNGTLLTRVSDRKAKAT